MADFDPKVYSERMEDLHAQLADAQKEWKEAKEDHWRAKAHRRVVRIIGELRETFNGFLDAALEACPMELPKEDGDDSE